MSHMGKASSLGSARNSPLDDGEDGRYHYHDTRLSGARRKASIEKTTERYYGKLALLQEWENQTEPDDPYLQKLRRSVDKCRQQLVVKNAL